MEKAAITYVDAQDALSALKVITLTAGAGISGGGDLSQNRSFALAIQEFSPAVPPDGAVFVWEDGGGNHFLVTKADLVSPAWTLLGTLNTGNGFAITGIAAGVRNLQLVLDGVAGGESNLLRLELGNSGGYAVACRGVASTLKTGSQATQLWANGPAELAGDNGDVSVTSDINGLVSARRLSNATWSLASLLGAVDDTDTYQSAGIVVITGELDRVRLSQPSAIPGGGSVEVWGLND